MPAQSELPKGTTRPRIRVPVKIEEALAAAAIALLALITFANVVVRYATNFSFAFTEEFSVFLMLAMALIGGASAMAKGGHLSISYLVEKFSPAAQRWIRIFSNGMVAVTFLILVVLGGQMAYDEYRFEVTSPGLGLPTWIYTVWLPILSLAILGRVLGVIVRVWRDRS